MKSYKKMNKTKKQKLYNMKGCSLAKYKKGGKGYKKCWGTQKGGSCGACMRGGRSRRNKKMLAYPASNSESQSLFEKIHLGYTGQAGGQNMDPNPNLPYGQTPPMNNEFPPGVSQPQDLRGGGEINENVIFGATNNYGGKARNRRGGMSLVGKWPDGLTGSPWGASNLKLPGADGISGDRNYLSYNKYINDPQTEGVVNGRALSGGKSKKRRGGGFIPQDLVNMGRQAMFGLGSSYNALTGHAPPVNPMPYKDHMPDLPSLNNLEYYRL
jgi:hypothetical protein